MVAKYQEAFSNEAWEKHADSVTSSTLHQVAFLNMSEALHKGMKNGVLGNILTVQLFLTYNVQETTQV